MGGSISPRTCRCNIFWTFPSVDSMIGTFLGIFCPTKPVTLSDCSLQALRFAQISVPYASAKTSGTTDKRSGSFRIASNATAGFLCTNFIVAAFAFPHHLHHHRIAPFFTYLVPVVLPSVILDSIRPYHRPIRSCH